MMNKNLVTTPARLRHGTFCFREEPSWNRVFWKNSDFAEILQKAPTSYVKIKKTT
jgi:hypothetical protein